MRNALIGGSSALAHTERASRRQPQGPEHITPSAFPANARVRKAGCPSVQVSQSKNVGTLDGSRPIINRGQARKAIKRVCAIIRADYGPKGCNGPEARDYFVVLAALDDVAAANDPSYVRCLSKRAKLYLPQLSDGEQAIILDELRRKPVVVSPRFLGELLGLTDARRDQFGFWGAEAIDMDAEARAAKLRANDRARKEKVRRQAGVPARGEAVAYERTLDPDVSLRTLQRRALARKASMAKAPKRKVGVR